jgi:hypothetical protein
MALGEVEGEGDASSKGNDHRGDQIRNFIGVTVRGIYKLVFSLLLVPCFYDTSFQAKKDPNWVLSVMIMTHLGTLIGADNLPKK